MQGELTVINDAMKKFKNIAFLLIAVIAIAIGFYVYSQYNRSTPGVSHMEAIMDIKAAALAKAFQDDETNANKKYLGKVIIISGPVAEIEEKGGFIRSLIIGKSEELHNVGCLFDSTFKVAHIAPGQEIKVKGICNGFLIDVELSRCILVTTSKH